MDADIGIDDRAVFEPAVNRDVVGRGDVHVFFRVGLEPLRHLRADERGQFSQLADHHAHRVKHVPERNRQGVRAQGHIALPGAIGGAGQHAAAHQHQVHRQHLSDVTLLDQLAHVQIGGRSATLQAGHGAHIFLARQRREFFGLFRIRAEGPFAVDVLARFNGVFAKLIVRRHAHRDQHGFDLRIGVQRLVVAVRAPHAELIGRRLRGIRMRGAHGIELGFGHAFQRRHVRARPPPAACSDEAYT